MSIYNSSITIGGVAINATSIIPRREQKTRNQVIGKTLVKTRILGMNDYQWVIQISGHIHSNLSAGRAALEALEDGTSKAYVDGIHDGQFFLVNLQFNDDSKKKSYYEYSFNLVEA